MARRNLRQFFKLSVCFLISAPLVFASFSILSDLYGERFSHWWGMAGCLAFWSFFVGICIPLFERLPLKKTLLEGIGLGLLVACVNFILVVVAMFVWLAFFFVS